jgi:hypothetical protein
MIPLGYTVKTNEFNDQVIVNIREERLNKDFDNFLQVVIDAREEKTSKDK